MAATNADLKIHMARRHWDIEGLDILNNLPKTYKKEWKCNKCDLVFHDYSVGFEEFGFSISNSDLFRIFKIISTVIQVKQTNFNAILCPYNCKSFSKLKGKKKNSFSGEILFNRELLLLLFFSVICSIIKDNEIMNVRNVIINSIKWNISNDI